MKKYIVEFIGTFFLVFTIGMTVIAPGVGPLAPLAIGSALMVMIYAGGHVSGAHYNPAVTIAVFLRGNKMSARDVLPYMVMQFLAAIAASLAVSLFKGPAAMAAVTSGPMPAFAAIMAEAIFTFALCWVILNSATAKGTAGNSFYGLAIGFTVLAGAYAVGGVSGAAFNPAVAVGATMMKLSAPMNIWKLLVGEVIGAVLAAIVFRMVDHPEEA